MSERRGSNRSTARRPVPDERSREPSHPALAKKLDLGYVDSVMHGEPSDSAPNRWNYQHTARKGRRGWCWMVWAWLMAAVLPLSAASSGIVVAWGLNDDGQTAVPASLGGVTAIAAGRYYTVALKSNGTVAAWGSNQYGQTAVPVGLSEVTAIAAGDFHVVALKSDGTVVAWGYNQYGQRTVPVGLSGVVAIAAGFQHTVALKTNGTVVAWGGNDWGQTTVPVGLSGVTAIAAGVEHTVALKSDGTVVVWGYNQYGQRTVPADLNGVTAIASGGFHVLALKSDGTVVAWGDNTSGQRSVPAGLSGVAAIAAGSYHSVVLKGDGTVVAWGYNYYGQTTVPTGLSGVTAIAGGSLHTVSSVVVFDPSPIGTEPQSQTVNSGATVSFTVSVSGTASLYYQWRTNGVDLAGATNQSLMLTNVTTANAGSYTVRVSNTGGSAVSAPGTLTVFNLTVDGLTAGSSIFRPGPAQVAIANHFPGGFLFYTLDGSTPTASSALYTGPFTLPSSATVRVLALSSDFLQSVPGPAVAVQIVPFNSVSLTTPGGGSASVSPAQASYPSNSVVTLTATPDTGWTFLRWEGDASSTNNPLALTVNAAKTVRATFGTPVARSAVGGGAVEFEPERAAYDFGSRLRAKALPNAGNKFVVWSGALSGITNGLDLTVTQPGQTVSALFTALAGNEFSLVALPVGPGNVTLNPYKNAYTLNEVVQLAATADGTNQFLGWTGDLSGTTSPVDVTMNASKRMTAFFGQPVPPVIISQPQGATVLAGTNLTLAVEASGPPLGFQWFHRGQSLTGATNTTLSLPNIARTQGGAYYVVITNLNGSTNSSNAVVRVLAPTRFLPPEFSVGTPLRLRFGDNGVGGVLTTNEAGNFEVHVSTNLVDTNWLRLNVPLTVTNGQSVFEDGESTTLPRRFYRVIER